MPAIPRTILVADDDPDALELLTLAVEAAGHVAVQARDGREALEAVRHARPEVVIADIMMPELSGLELLERLGNERPELPVIITTADTRVPTVVEAMKIGAFNFIAKPIDERLLAVTIEQALQRVLLERRVRSLTDELDRLRGLFPNLIVQSPAMQRVLRQARASIDSNATVLLLGESGTGKSLLARELHRAGARAAGPFIAVNCAAIPEPLLESELFGHEKGAYTGADIARIGKFEAANGGILLLDEIGELAQSLQAKLLRVLQDREVVHLGSNTPVPIDVRVIAATNCDLERKLQKREFRADLYYRLAVLEIDVPPLRERVEDIAPLAEQFLELANADEGKNVRTIDAAALDLLKRFDYPGNIRQLENIVRRAVVICEGPTITVADLQPSVVRRALGRPEGVPESGPQALGGVQVNFTAEADIPQLAAVEDVLIREAVAACRGNISRAAKRLAIGRATIYRRLNARDADDARADDTRADDTAADAPPVVKA